MKFVDEVRIRVASGRGGKGCISFRREKYIPRGGPDGGDGGKGGDVIIRATHRLTTLLDLKYRRDNSAKSGGVGAGSNRHGADAPDLIILVPVGTCIEDAGSGEMLADLIEDGQIFTAAKGGRGGKGNAHFTSATRQAPRFAQPGEEEETCDLKLELKLLADVGIIGFPNAGKSTLISKISKARPKIADYPFTTLTPNLGVVRYKNFRSFVVADIPGLIEGAHAGAGLGIRFLRHVERTSVFIHMLDVSELTGRDPLEDLDIINRELDRFNSDLSGNPQLVALNKIDLIADRGSIDHVENSLADKGCRVFRISAVTGEGVDALVDAVAEIFFRKMDEKEGDFDEQP